MTNAFEQAEKELDNRVLEQEEMEEEDTVLDEETSKYPDGKEIDVDTLNYTEWVKSPKEIGESTGVITVGKFLSRPGRMVTPKGKDAFWSGLQKKDKTKGTTENCDEYVLFGVREESEVAFKCPSWETVFKLTKLVRYCKMNKMFFVGQKVEFKRIAKGTASQGRNWELHVPSLGIKIVGESHEVQKLV